ncbi:Z1 domain-containing protein [Clostridium sp. LCP25S3_F10]|uniref:Z1 domain-containing protein n=1 Tax=Clostridium sp. LCP25S3_F10 TaxID=3438750 RepID=UPI003F910DE0
MININKLDESEMKFYKSAYEFYEGKLNKNADDIGSAIRDAVEQTMFIFSSVVLNADNLRKYLNEQISMIREQQQPVFMTGLEVRNSVWWDEFIKENSTEYWNRYEKYLLENKGWPRSSIDKSINNTTNKVMNAIADPNKKMAIERKGMVIGYVQSGKTAHYIGVINKAIDAGYKIIIVLAGMHNNLRAQTQSRIDEEVLGFETSLDYLLNQMKKEANIIGVGKKLVVKNDSQTLTSRDEKGDFNRDRQQIFVSPEIPTIFVVKKNSKVLEALIRFFKNNKKHSIDKDTGRKYMDANYPLLLIDDEADQASINTKYEYKDGVIKNRDKLSTINAQIRDLFHIFDCCSYIGYTATPYANIFIPSEVESKKHGKDLFPTHFILTLPKPHNYIGAHEYFGKEGQLEMPLRRQIGINSLSFVDQKNKTVKKELPDDLKHAIKSFLISTATRICRGQNGEPNTMLIHVTRLTDTQKLVHKRVAYYYENIGNKIIDGHLETISDLKTMWQEDYEQTTQNMRRLHENFMEDIPDTTWEEVFQKICNLIENDQVKIYRINGKSKDALLYKEHKGKQYNVIAIGGDKLSRGLTLEGLTVSYFTRESKMYDTLMQMGRWFGFRPGYADLCRLFVQDDLYAWFRHISFATDDLREQIEYMNNIEETPENFGLRVATHPNMKISGANKVQSGEERRITFSNVFSQTRSMDINAEKYDKNFEAVDNLLKLCGKSLENYWKKMGREKNRNNHLFWKNMDGHYIKDFLLNYETSRQANKANSKYMADYIEDQMKNGGLLRWTVCLLNLGDENNKIEFSNVSVASGMMRKNIIKVNEEFCSIQTLTSEDVQFYDFSKEDMLKKEEEAKKFKKNGKKMSNDYVRKVIRNREEGLLVICPIDTNKGNGKLLIDKKKEDHKVPIGIAIAFPHNKDIGNIKSYRINDIGLKGEEDELFE